MLPKGNKSYSWTPTSWIIILKVSIGGKLSNCVFHTISSLTFSFEMKFVYENRRESITK